MGAVCLYPSVAVALLHFIRAVISKPKRRPCNRKTDNKTTRLLTSKLTFGRQKLG